MSGVQTSVVPDGVLADDGDALLDGAAVESLSPAGAMLPSTLCLFYFDPDTSWEAEDAVIRAGASLFADLPVPVEQGMRLDVYIKLPFKKENWMKYTAEVLRVEAGPPARAAVR